MLAGADHLLSSRGDAAYVANTLASWAELYFDMSSPLASGGGHRGVSAGLNANA
jgi:hypothetical protein